MVSSHDPIDPGAENNAADHRASRSKVLKGAHAAFNHEFSAIPCTLRDVSLTGARVIFEGGWFVPDHFTLHVDIDGYKIECERVWQRGSECGVRFISEKFITGKPRQQVLTPEPLADEAAPAPVTASLQPPSRDQLRPLPARKPQGGGFGRRTR